MRILFLALACVLSVSAYAQDQLLVRLGHEGIKTILKAALTYNQADQKVPGFKVPAGLYSFKVKQADIAANPLVQMLRDLTDVDIRRDYPFYVYNSPISVTGMVDLDHIKTTTSNYNSRGFDLRIALNVTSLKAVIPDISLCEKKKGNNCGPGLRASFKNSSIALARGSVVELTADFHVDVRNELAKLTLVRATSNLESAHGPKLIINVGSLVIPPVSIVVNGQEAQLDTSAVREKLLQFKVQLANKLLSFASDFIAQDMAEMVNKILKTQTAPTRLSVIDIDPLHASNQPLVTKVCQDNNDFMVGLQRDIAQLIKSAQLDLSLKNLRTINDQEVELRLDTLFKLNGVQSYVGTSAGWGPYGRSTPPLNVDAFMPKGGHLGFAISEATVNAALALINSTGLFNRIIDNNVPSGGLSLSSAKVHFASGTNGQADRIYAIANLSLDLVATRTTDLGSWFSKWTAISLENIPFAGTGGKLFFPLQFTITPQLFRSTTDKKMYVFLNVNAPFSESTLRNDYAYPSNLNKATGIVRDNLVKILKKSIGPLIAKPFVLPLDAFLNLTGVSWEPTSFKVVDSAYAFFSADIKNIDLRAGADDFGRPAHAGESQCH